jgi:hypothetical protein
MSCRPTVVEVPSGTPSHGGDAHGLVGSQLEAGAPVGADVGQPAVQVLVGGELGRVKAEAEHHHHRVEEQLQGCDTLFALDRRLTIATRWWGGRSA